MEMPQVFKQALLILEQEKADLLEELAEKEEMILELQRQLARLNSGF